MRPLALAVALCFLGGTATAQPVRSSTTAATNGLDTVTKLQLWDSLVKMRLQRDLAREDLDAATLEVARLRAIPPCPEGVISVSKDGPPVWLWLVLAAGAFAGGFAVGSR